MTHFCVADRDTLANNVSYNGGSYTHHVLILLGLFSLCLYLCVDLLFLRNEIICVFLGLNGV